MVGLLGGRAAGVSSTLNLLGLAMTFNKRPKVRVVWSLNMGCQTA